jgi:2-keto-3-deoxy-L-rhamnonate aldolase RhmA
MSDPFAARLRRYVGSAAAAKPYLEKGFSLIAVGIDTLMLANAARQIAHALQ